MLQKLIIVFICFPLLMECQTSIKLNTEIQSEKYKLDKLGYVFSSFDSILDSNGQFLNYLIERNIRLDTLLLEIYSQTDTKIQAIKVNDIVSLNKYLTKLLNQYQTDGYLRSNYKLDTFIHRNSKFIFKYKFDLGKKFEIDSIRIFGNQESIDQNFIKKIISLDKNKYGNYSFNNIIDLIKNIDFIELEKNPNFSISDTFTILNLYIRERKYNQVNATIGILSHNDLTNSVLITGDAQLSLYNLLKRGVEFNLNWQKNNLNNQFLFLKSSIPYLLNTKFGLTNQFSIEKFDTLYQRIQNQLGIDYYITFNHSVTVLYKYQSSRIEGFDENKIIQGILPTSLDYSFQQFGIGYKFRKLDRPLFTKKGYKIESNFLLGNKLIEKNNAIVKLIDANGHSMSRIYDSINLSLTMTTFFLNFYKYTPLSNQLILRSTIDSRVNLSQNIGVNEMYNIGGLRFPRGYDDNSLVTANYFILSNDLQYYLAEYFYSNIFADITIMQNSFSPNNLLYPIGLGFGLSFKSSTSILQLNLGTSLSENTNLSINNSKVHIQYINVF